MSRPFPGSIRIGNFVYRSLFQRIAEVRVPRPIISFTFDDFPRSAWQVGGSILGGMGIQATYYAAFNLMNGTGANGAFFQIDDVHGLLEQGNELGCHTFSHLNASHCPGKRFLADIDCNRQALLRYLPQAHFEHFAFPYGAMGLGARIGTSRRFVSSRTTQHGINEGRIDLNGLRANKLYSDSVTIDDVKSLIEKNAARRGWLIFYTHDVQPQPGEFGCTPAYLEQVSREAVSSGAELLTIGEAVNRLTSKGVAAA